MTSAGTTGQTGAERGGRPNNDRDRAEWPALRPADLCDGKNPMTGRTCINGRHPGYHRDATGAEWLED
ncbi:hypothetical protein GCM10009741_44960 [Kribbella lupini]|uniref:HNH endonuclease n=1 Tax=Kribbella lupini TaxID=291602 RepID=A0ABN2BC30_9ACTN